MKKLIFKSVLTGFSLFTASYLLAHDNHQANSVSQAIDEGELNVNFRYRLESVDQDNALKDALASTLRSRLTFSSKQLNDFSAIVEVDNVAVIGDSRQYNSLTNGVTDHSVVADPTGTELNQAAVRYHGFTDTQVVFGRQRINLGNQRFVGGAAFRQNEQTYDGLTLLHQINSAAKISYGYIQNINNILGGNNDTDIHLLHFDWNASNWIHAAAYAYFFDINSLPTQSNRTIGFRVNSSKNFGQFSWVFEYADQTDYADNPTDLNAGYYLLQGAYTLDEWKFTLAQEVLQGDADNANNSFQTPLATKHKFQGWADIFLTTPQAGIEDTYLSVAIKIDKNSFAVIYHDFQAEDSSLDYGTEIDFMWSHQLSAKHSVMLKFADYNADNFAVDTQKIWLMFSANY